MMLRESLQAPVGGRRYLSEAVVNLVGDPTALLFLDRDHPFHQALLLALAFGQLLVEAAEFFLGALALGDVADHHADDSPTAIRDHVRTDLDVDQGAILAAVAPLAAYVAA